MASSSTSCVRQARPMGRPALSTRGQCPCPPTCPPYRGRQARPATESIDAQDVCCKMFARGRSRSSFQGLHQGWKSRMNSSLHEDRCNFDLFFSWPCVSPVSKSLSLAVFTAARLPGKPACRLSSIKHISAPDAGPDPWPGGQILPKESLLTAHRLRGETPES